MKRGKPGRWRFSWDWLNKVEWANVTTKALLAFIALASTGVGSCFVAGKFSQDDLRVYKREVALRDSAQAVRDSLQDRGISLGAHRHAADNARLWRVLKKRYGRAIANEVMEDAAPPVTAEMKPPGRLHGMWLWFKNKLTIEKKSAKGATP